jgi:hypothetical protein
MASQPLFATLASRALDHQKPTRSARPRFRRRTARVGQLVAGRDPKAPAGAGELGPDRPHRDLKV